MLKFQTLDLQRFLVVTQRFGRPVHRLRRDGLALQVLQALLDDGGQLLDRPRLDEGTRGLGRDRRACDMRQGPEVGK